MKLSTSLPHHLLNGWTFVDLVNRKLFVPGAAFATLLQLFCRNLRVATIFKNWIKVAGQIILVATLKLLSICCTSVAKAAVRMNGFLLTRSANAHPLTWWWLWWCGNDLGSGVSTLRGGLNPDYSILKQQIIKKCDICATDDDTIIIYYIFKKMQGEIQLII